MLKYTDAEITFAEVPDEIALCVNISGCPCHCEGCHSSYLADDIGEPLTIAAIEKLLDENQGVSTICFMGGDSDPSAINELAEMVKLSHSIKVGWYSGRQELSDKIDLWNFDFIKLGPYIANKGPLNSRTTNQKFYEVLHFSTGKSELSDITHKFWREDD